MKKVSIILPVYNVEKYIDKCAESIVNQTYSNIEIIFVNDGSSDNSYDKLIDWSKKDKRIIVLDQKNSGSGIARNYGLSIAKGEYVIFVDPDDWIDEDFVETLINEIETTKVDFLTSGCVNEYYDEEGNIYKTVEDNFKKEIITNIDVVHNNYIDLLFNGGAGAPTKKVYKMSIIKDNNIQFPDFKRSQDIVFNYRYYDCIKSLEVLNVNKYHYRIEPVTYKKKIHNNYYKDVCTIYTDISNLFKKWNVTLSSKKKDEFIKFFYELIVWQISIGNSSANMKDIVNKKEVQEIFKQGKPQGLKQKLLTILVLKKKYKTINLIIKLLKISKK